MAAMKVIRRNLMITVIVLISMLFTSNIVISGRTAQIASSAQDYAVEQPVMETEIVEIAAFDSFAG